jgi:hypothetical protein
MPLDCPAEPAEGILEAHVDRPGRTEIVILRGLRLTGWIVSTAGPLDATACGPRRVRRRLDNEERQPDGDHRQREPCL